MIFRSVRFVRPAATTCSILALAAAMALPGAIARAAPPRDGDTPPVANPAADSDALRAGFETPPPAARPRVWWHWMNGNVTIDGIDKDLAWLAGIGIGGVQNFDVDLTSPQIVQQRLVYMGPQWKAAFRHAVDRADSLGLEFAIASSPGWSETGGPWVPPQDGLKKLGWSETVVPGGVALARALAAVPGTTGPYPGIDFVGLFDNRHPNKAPLPAASGEIGVFAVPAGKGAAAAAAPAAVATATIGGARQPATALLDTSPETALSAAMAPDGSGASVELDAGRVLHARSARIYVQDARPPFSPPRYLATLQAEVGGSWRDLAPVPLFEVPTTVAFDAVDARRFRLAIRPGPRASSGDLGSVPGAVIVELFPPRSNATVEVGAFELFETPRVHLAEAKAGFATVPDYYALEQASDVAGPAPGQVIDLTSRMRADGTLDWTPPAGQDWRILRFGWSLTGKTNHPAPAEATGLEVDKYDAGAVERYLTHYLTMYRDVVGPERMGARGIRALLTDSIEVGPSNWTPALLAEFQKRRGYDARPWLPVLAGVLVGTQAEADRFLADYRQTLSDLIAEAHYGTIAKVAHAHGLSVYGESLEDGRPVLGNDLDMRSSADVPMAALWTFPRGGAPRAGLVGDMRGAASVAHFWGKTFVAAESMTSAFSPWAFAPADLKHVIDLEFAEGINRPVIHTSVHQATDDKLPGMSLAIFGQYFNRHESWATMAKPWVDYMARTSFLLQRGRNVADVGIFYGEEAPATMLYGGGTPAWLPKTVSFDLLSARMLAALTVDGEGRLASPGGARYSVLQLAGSSARMSLATLRALDALVERGAKIVGARPTAGIGLGDDPAAFAALVTRIWSRPNVIDSGDIEAGLSRLGIQADHGAAIDAGQLRFVHRKLDDGDLYFVSNRENRPLKTVLRFRVTGKAPELWRATDGSATPIDYRVEGQHTLVPVELTGEDAVFVVFRKPATATERRTPAPVLADGPAIDGPWEVTFEPGRGAPDRITMPSLVPLERNGDPRVRYFSGIATYRTSFDLPAMARGAGRIWLDLGRLGDVAEVRVNGKLAGIAWLAPYRVEVGSLLASGRNQVEVKVANLWVNRLIGDHQPGAKPITWTPTPTYKADAPLRPAGLIGPVRLVVAR